MALELYNSLSRTRETFVPQDPARVTMYACGPTVYNPPHIGNARAAVVYDLLFRVLRHRYDDVVYARNITDVDDKINAAAREEGVPISTVTDRYTAVYHRDMEALGVLPPSMEPRATATMSTIIAMIEGLIASGHAYAADGHVLFNVPSFDAYGELSGRNRDDMIAGARVEVAPYKRDDADFVLWKPSEAALPGWDSPWGRGRPGWHIECSAMISAHLGTTIDIHGGGNDLKFPHHENEIAQSRCAHDGAALARYWVHNGFVQIDDAKMSKSIGNVLLVDDLLEDHPGEAIRYALLMSRYREPLNWSDALIGEARASLDHLYGALKRLQGIEAAPASSSEFDATLDDDLNTAEALALLRQTARQANVSRDPGEQRRLKAELLGAGLQLGLLQQDPAAWFAAGASLDEGYIRGRIEAREAARERRDFAAADQIRDELAAAGIQLLDGPDGTEWRTAD